MARFVMNDYSRCSSVTSMLNHLSWPTLANRRACLKLLCTYQCNAQLPLIRVGGGGRSGMVGELIAKFSRHSGDLSSLKKFTQTAQLQRAIDLNSEPGASSWLLALPLQYQGYHLTKQ